jgi:hypothetical protein
MTVWSTVGPRLGKIRPFETKHTLTGDSAILSRQIFPVRADFWTANIQP